MNRETALSAGRAPRPPGGLRALLRNTFALALVVSLGAHLLALLFPAPRGEAPEELPPLAATITHMPPPPVPVAKPARPKPRAKFLRPRAMPPFDAAQAAIDSDGIESASSTGQAIAPMAEPAFLPERTEEAIAAAAPAEHAPPELPPRIELAYRGFLGTRGFFVGDATYRLEHSGSQYKVTTIGEARGLAALFIHGQGRLTSTGTITGTGLQPNLYTIERTNDNRHEAATFDWETGLVLLNDNKTAALDVPTFDPLVVLWQFYFVPPEQDDVQLNIATTRRVYHYSLRRTGAETIKLSFGDVVTEVWERTSGDGSVNAKVWLAPSLHHVMVKMRLWNERATVEALLDAIRVDEKIAQR
jgi:hypothetical protein